MKKYRITIIVLAILFAVVPSVAKAQQNFGFYNGLKHLPQAHYYNPAFNAKNKIYFSIGTGLHSFGLGHSGFTFNDLFRTRSQDDSLVVSPANAIAQMKDLNFLNLNVQNELFGLGIKIRKMYFSFNVINRLNFQMAYPKDLFKLAFEGNAGSLLGQRASLDGLGISLNSYLEAGIGVNRSFLNDKLKVGARAKLLSGLANISTVTSKLGLTTNAQTFDLTLDGELDIRTAGLPIDSFEVDPLNILNFKNRGLAFDFGASYQLTDKLMLSASVLDLGGINWNTGVSSYTRSAISYTFSGIDANEAFNDSSYFDTFVDSLEDIFRVEGNSNNYRSTLPARFILGANYDFTKFFGGGAVLFSDFSNRKYRPTLMLTGTFHIKEIFHFNVNYLASSRSFKNLGVGFSLKGAGMSYFVSTDNILFALSPGDAKNIHVSTGLSFFIGRDKEDKKAKKAKKEASNN